MIVNILLASVAVIFAALYIVKHMECKSQQDKINKLQQAGEKVIFRTIDLPFKTFVAETAVRSYDLNTVHLDDESKSKMIRENLASQIADAIVNDKDTVILTEENHYNLTTTYRMNIKVNASNNQIKKMNDRSKCMNQL